MTPSKGPGQVEGDNDTYAGHVRDSGRPLATGRRPAHGRRGAGQRARLWKVRPSGRILTLGDAVLDVLVQASRPLVVDGDIPGSTRLALGGQAANVAAWCVALGRPAGVICAVGTDLAGRFVTGELAAREVDILGPELSGPSGVIVSLTGPQGRRTMISDRGVSAKLAPGDLRESWFQGCAWLHISGYALFDPAGSKTAVTAARLAVEAGARVSVDLAAETAVTACGADVARQLLDATQAAVVFGNQAEHAAFGAAGICDGTVIVKRGAGGFQVRSGGVIAEHAAQPVEAVLDTTGAGDAFAAGWLVGGETAAARSAARAVAQLGAMPEH